MSSTGNRTSSTKPPYAKLRLQLKGMRDNIGQMDVSPDCLNVAAVTIKGEVRVWEISDGSGFVLKQPVADDTRLPSGAVSFSSNGRYLAVAIEKTVHLWIAKTGQPKFDFPHPDLITSAKFSPDSKRLACGYKDIHIWDVETKQQVHVLKGHTNYVWALSFFSGGTQLVSASWDSSLRIWNLGQGEKLQDTWKGHGSKLVYCCAVSPDEQMLASGGVDNQVILWDLKSGDWLTKPYQGHNDWVTWIAFSPDGRHIASASSAWPWGVVKGKVHIQDAKSGSFVAEIESSYFLVAYTPDGKQIITVDKEDRKLLRVLELTTPAVPRPAGQTQGASSSATSTTLLVREAHPGSALDTTLRDDNLPPPYDG